MNWMDFIVIGFIAFHCVVGFRAGLILSTFNLIGIVAGIIISNIYYSQVAEWIITNSDWVETLRKGISDNLIGPMGGNGINNIDIMNAIKDVPIPDGMKETFISSDIVQNAMVGSTNQLNTVLVDWITNSLINLISVVLVFLAVIIVVKILAMIIDQIVKIPVLKEINQFGGLLFGVAKGILYVMVIMLLVPPISAMFPDLGIMNTLNSSQVALYFHEYNIVFLVKI